jgi:hypothetical protein
MKNSVIKLTPVGHPDDKLPVRCDLEWVILCKALVLYQVRNTRAAFNYSFIFELLLNYYRNNFLKQVYITMANKLSNDCPIIAALTNFSKQE